MGLNSRRSECPALWAEAIEALPFPVAIVDARFTLVDANPSWNRLFPAVSASGSLPDYLQAWSSWNPPAVLDDLRDRLQRVLHGDTIVPPLELLGAPDTAPLHVRMAPVEYNTQRYALLTHTSVSLLAAANAAGPDDAIYRNAFQSSCIAAAILGLDGEIRQANPSFCRLTGYAGETLPGTSFLSITHADDQDLWSYETQRMVQGELPRVQVSQRIQHGNGTMMRVLLSASLLRDQHGQAQNIIAQLQDISDRNRAEEELRRQALTFENISEGVVLTRHDGVILDWNPAAERILGFSSGEVLGISLNALIALESPQTFDHIHQQISHGQRWGGELKLRHKDGSIRVCEGIAAPSGEEASDSLTVMYFLRDVTEARHLESQLRHAQKMEAVGQLAGGVAHDFNNLLTVVKGHTALLLKEFSSDSPQRQRILQITEAAERAAALTRQLLAYSRRQVLAPRLFDINTVVENLAPMLRRLINEDIDVEIKLYETPLWVKADAGQVDQVILNLAVNARDAIPQRGTITIASSLLTQPHLLNANTLLAPESFVVLSVHDTGVGMSREVQSHIFDPFFTTKETGRGTGLGLAMVYGIIRQSGGYIDVSSAPGKGSCFDVYLPCAEAPRRELQPAREHVATASTGNETILVVEDEEGVRELICDVLRQLGYQVLDASGSEAALNCAVQHSGTIDLMVTDVVMPRMGGRELAQRMAALRPRMRVLYISGYTDDAVVRHGVQESRMAFLQKPFSPSQLSQKIREVLHGPAGPPAARA